MQTALEYGDFESQDEWDTYGLIEIQDEVQQESRIVFQTQCSSRDPSNKVYQFSHHVHYSRKGGIPAAMPWCNISIYTSLQTAKRKSG